MADMLTLRLAIGLILIMYVLLTKMKVEHMPLVHWKRYKVVEQKYGQ